MKKLLIITSIALVAVLALGVTGFAFAQSPTPQSPATPGAGQGQGGWANGAPRLGLGGRAGQFGGAGAFAARAGNGYGLMHTEMLATFAQAFNMNQEDLQTRLDAGETMWAIAQEKGLSADQFTQLMQQARSTALQQAVTDGTLTQAQADWMQQRSQGNYPDGYGPGSVNCDGSGMHQGGRGGRMQNSSQP
ncbi:MAG: hypothetical protein P8Z00_22970 [Anaerolineales bacterium]|jgi:hypothetical protein